MILNKAIIIEKKKLLLVEGKDDENFFQVLLKKHNMQDIQIIASGGKDQFANIFPQIKLTPQFDNLVSLAVVQDADTNADDRFKSICNTLKKSDELQTPQQIEQFIDSTPKIGVFIAGKNKKGSLEDLCLSTVTDSEKIIKECIDPFMRCMEKYPKYGKPKNKSKARVRALLSAMKEETSSLGVAAQKGYWDLDSDTLQPLVSFLKKM